MFEANGVEADHGARIHAFGISIRFYFQSLRRFELPGSQIVVERV